MRQSGAHLQRIDRTNRDLHAGVYGSRAATIACIIEFGVKDGRDQDRKRLLAKLFVELDKLISCRRKPSMMWTVRIGASRSHTGRMRMRCAVGCSMRRTSARSGSGSAEIFSHYNIKIATIERETDWTAPAGVTVTSPAAGGDREQLRAT